MGHPSIDSQRVLPIGAPPSPDARSRGVGNNHRHECSRANNSGFQSGPGAPGGSAPQSNGLSNNPPVQNLSGDWTIYANNAKNPGSSLKEIQLTQNGNILSGNFQGPHQHGKLQGWVSGNNVQFSTDTRNVLTFEGQITSTGMSGFYTVNGSSAPWNAQRTN